MVVEKHVQDKRSKDLVVNNHVLGSVLLPVLFSECFFIDGILLEALIVRDNDDVDDPHEKRVVYSFQNVPPGCGIKTGCIELFFKSSPLSK